jgi:hypothetical protein
MDVKKLIGIGLLAAAFGNTVYAAEPVMEEVIVTGKYPFSQVMEEVIVTAPRPTELLAIDVPKSDTAAAEHRLRVREFLDVARPKLHF